jgi:thioredoxin 1
MKLLRDVTAPRSLEAALENGKPIIVDFYTPNCVFCKKIEPMLVALKGDFEGRLDVVKIDAAANLEIAAKYEVRGVPTLILFTNGNAQDRKTGFMTVTMLRDWIKPFL